MSSPIFDSSGPPPSYWGRVHQLKFISYKTLMTSNDKPTHSEASGVQSKLLLIVIGIIIPLVAAGVPFFIEFFSPKSSLVFEAVGPLQVDNTKTFSIFIRNEGKAAERNVEIWLPGTLEKGKYKIGSSQSVTPRIEGKSTVLALGDLRPSEKIEITVMVEDPLFFIWDHRLKDLRIISTDNKATWGGKSDEAWFIYRTGFWAFLVLLAVGIVAGLYQEHFMSRAAREKMILKEMEKLK